MKIIALYLPQFHEIPENNEWWGKGFTEWSNVKKAKPLFQDHKQPKVPLHKNYYNLLDDNVKIWQANLAKEYGIYGFCYYHYWFNGRLLLEKPMEQMLVNKKIDIPFCIFWANEQWSKQWVGENKILIPQTYGNKEEWIQHFNYCLPFFKDQRYIKNENKPLFIIYHPESFRDINEMIDCWNSLAKKNGFDGIDFGYYSNWKKLDKKADDSHFRYSIQGQPGYALGRYNKKRFPIIRKFGNKFSTFFERLTGRNLKLVSNVSLTQRVINYDKIWNEVLEERPDSNKSIPGAFVNWDNTPRYKNKGRVFIGSTPEKFKNYLSKEIRIADDIYHSDYIFLFAWNEWCEGSYLEPDEDNKYQYLEAVKAALDENKR